MIAISAHYDGKVIIPDEPLDLPPNQALVIRIEVVEDAEPAGGSTLAWLAENASESQNIPPDLSQQHDHYLYGLPKKAL